jgi:hypothetical protein
MRHGLTLSPEDVQQIIADYINNDPENKLNTKVKAEDVYFELENIGDWADDGQYVSEIIVEVKD